MAETSLVMRDGNGNHNSSPTFYFSVWGHPRIPRVSKNMNALCRRKSNNGKKTNTTDSQQRCLRMKRCAQLDNFSSQVIQDLFLFWLLWWFSARFPQYRKRSILRELVEVVCNTHFLLSSVSFLHLTLLLDSFYRRFLIMRHISNVASQFTLSEFLFLCQIAQIIIF